MDRIDDPVVWSCLVYCLESVQQQIQRKGYHSMASIQECITAISHSPWTENLRSCLSQSSHHLVFHIFQMNCTFMDSLNYLLSIKLLQSKISHGKECGTLIRWGGLLDSDFRGFFPGFWLCCLLIFLGRITGPLIISRLLSYHSVISFWSSGTVTDAVISCPEGFACGSSLSFRPLALHVRTHGSFLCFHSFS